MTDKGNFNLNSCFRKYLCFLNFFAVKLKLAYEIILKLLNGKFMNYDAAFTKLQEIKQEHLLQFFEELIPCEKASLLNQVDLLEIETFKQQQALVLTNRTDQREEVAPFTNAAKEKDIDPDLGKTLIADGKLGCLLVAGGQGSRLQFDGPKGTFPVSAVKLKSLFQIFAEKTVAATKLANRSLQLAIMTSEENDKEVKFFFKNNDYFGLSLKQISFFSQKNLPFLNLEGNLFLQNPFTIARGPDGNGGSLKTFYESGIFDKWYNKGVRFVNFVLVDNPLADPFDSKILAFQSRQKAEIVVKCIKRESPEENVGILVRERDKLKVLEYSELSDQERFDKDSNGNLKHLFANISLFSFSMDFIKKIAVHQETMPLHKALKALPFLDENAQTIKPTFPNGWKFEKFIFDLLPLAEHIEVIEYSRKNCFAPLKNLSGNHSLETLQKQSQELDYKTISKITGRKDPFIKPFEIAQDFYYPTDELINKWKGKALPSKHYIEG